MKRSIAALTAASVLAGGLSGCSGGEAPNPDVIRTNAAAERAIGTEMNDLLQEMGSAALSTEVGAASPGSWVTATLHRENSGHVCEVHFEARVNKQGALGGWIHPEMGDSAPPAVTSLELLGSEPRIAFRAPTENTAAPYLDVGDIRYVTTPGGDERQLTHAALDNAAARAREVLRLCGM